jgi:cytochrome c biogenesis protein CcmG/thiol:disulfide interchange protein DsbE
MAVCKSKRIAKGSRKRQEMRRNLSHAFFLGAIGVLFAALAIGIVPRTRGVWAIDERPAEGHQAPDFALKTLDGKTMRLSELRSKKVVLINFWATWCPPCRLEMPTMQKIYSEYKGRGFEIVAINIEPDAQEEIREFMKELRLTFPVLLDHDMKVTRKYRLIGLPVSFLIDRQGIIRTKDVGYHDWTDKESRRQVESLLK